MYSGLGWLLYFTRGFKEDSINTISATTLTGLAYKSTAGIKKCGLGGAVGLGLSLLYVGFTSRDKLKDQYGGAF